MAQVKVMAKKLKENPLGRKYFRLKVISLASPRNGHVMFNCKCDCGKECIVRGSALISGNTLSCGCLNKQKGKNVLRGYRLPMVGSKINGKHTPEYMAWRAMKARCYTKTHKKYKNYGGRGITVCERWLESFNNFFKDMGKRPAHCNSVERVNVNREYSRSNCIWATEKIQAANKTNTVRLIVSGKEVHQSELARRLGITSGAIRNHRKKGKNGDQIVAHFQKVKK